MGGYLAEVIGELLLMAINATLDCSFHFYSLKRSKESICPKLLHFEGHVSESVVIQLEKYRNITSLEWR